MKLEDNICPICLYIFIQPVTMPCEHELCLSCFKQNVEEANFCCPMCRTRISTWARRAARTKKLVNNERWEEIQKNFPEQIRKRQEGEEEEDPEMNALNISIKLAEPGEIRNEYEQQLKKLQEQRAEERRREQEASERLIQEIQEEEKKRQEELKTLQERDEELAKQLSQIVSPEAQAEVRTRSAASNPKDSRPASTMENFLGKLDEDDAECLSPARSPYPYPCLTPISSGAGKLCVDRDKVKQMEDTFLKRKIKKDKNLITTSDIEKLEETFTRNCRSKTASATEIAIPEILQTGTKATASPTLTNTMSSASLHKSEILDQMSKEVCINLVDDESSNSNLISIESSPHSEIKEQNIEQDPFLRSISSHSIDSISQELNHFRPIRSCPLTPPRRLPSGKVVEPKLIRTTPRNLSGSGFTSPVETNMSDIDAGSPVMQRRLSQLADERKDQVERMSKSTSTGVVTSPDENLNPEKKKSAAGNQLTFSHLSSRSVELKDISNSPSTTHDSHPSRKLIIPLEPDLAENDWLGSTGSFSPVKIERVTPVQLSESARKRSSKLSRNRAAKKSKVRYTAEGPQPSLMNWMKKTDPLCIDEDGNSDDIVSKRLDEVDGEKKLLEKKPVRITGTSALDEYLANGAASNYSPRSRRNHRMYKDPDFVYESSVMVRNYDKTEENESNNGSDDFSFSKNTTKRKLSSSDSCSSSPKKKSRTKNRDEDEILRRKVGLKKPKQPVKSRKLAKSGCVTQKPKAVRTMHDFFCNLNNNSVDEPRSDEESDQDEKELDQEEKDRLLALELQKQFELEAKLNLSVLRFKGTSEEYSLRKNRKVKEVADA
ncbi:E3 ubiquitin-protein ligase rnf168-like [Mercenaria mercenaria]|uniref:E3 ubiquitin-protein ligase rnf168-like n=1 Tax=Mercenaria mercenaria TaxID=6596 RepID=UPI00234F8614|nr:E3 ubiquitin-protein ligase rnf168-like [Mercenaria mercenaria]